jgi:hypothetical protein
MTRIVSNPCYLTNGKIIDIDLNKAVLHTVTGERMTEEYFERLADEAETANRARVEAEDAQKASSQVAQVTTEATLTVA